MIMRKRAALIPILAVFLVAVFLCALPQQAFAVDSRGVGRGTLGLMEYVAGGDFNSIQKQDADLAIRWLTGAESKQAWYDRYVDLGESGDATSIENLENALSYMDAVNGIRKANGLNELKVSLSLMAGAELNCSYSGSIMGHSGAYMTPSGLGSYGSENLAWRSGAFVGSSDPADWSPNDYSVNWPFTGWYTQEKQKYEAGNTDYSSVGHYLNFIASDIESFGFGVGDGAVIWKGSDFEGSFTVSEFKRLVAEYKSTFFIDVYDATAHSEDIWWLSDTGISEGFYEPDGSRTYRGMSSVARQDMAAFIHRLADYEHAVFDQDDETAFSDVSSSTPHSEDILWLAASGISEGFKESDGTFTYRGMSSIARQDMAAFLYRLAGSPDYTPSAGVKDLFSDVDASNPHYKEILWLAETGVSEGFYESDGSRTFRGMSDVARQDMAAFLHRMSEKGLIG